MRVLSIQATWVPPPNDVRADRFCLLSENLEGDILQPVWFERPEEVENLFGQGSYPEYQRGRFHYHWFTAFRYSGLMRKIRAPWFYISKGLEVYRKKQFDCIVVYSHMAPALAGLVLKWLTGAKLIVEIMTAPELSYLYEHTHRTWGDRFMRMFSDFCLNVTVRGSDRVHLLYGNQLASYPGLRNIPSSVFTDFVPVSLIPASPDGHEPLILMVGAPWYLKGADILIRAFKKIADEFPEVKLRIQGHNPNSPELEAMARHPRIEVVRAVPNPETLRRISRALILAHPSRCDGVPRVLVEALGAGIPVVATNVGGNPATIRHGENGYLIPAEDADELASRLRELLSDSELRRKMGAKGYEMAHAQFSERVYVEQFTRMVEAAVRGDR